MTTPNILNGKSRQRSVRVPIPVDNLLKEVAVKNINNTRDEVATEINTVLLAWYKRYVSRRRRPAAKP